MSMLYYICHYHKYRKLLKIIDKLHYTNDFAYKHKGEKILLSINDRFTFNENMHHIIDRFYDTCAKNLSIPYEFDGEDFNDI